MSTWPARSAGRPNDDVIGQALAQGLVDELRRPLLALGFVG
jgi:hypothetical protein